MMNVEDKEVIVFTHSGDAHRIVYTARNLGDDNWVITWVSPSLGFTKETYSKEKVNEYMKGAEVLSKES